MGVTDTISMRAVGLTKNEVAYPANTIFLSRDLAELVVAAGKGTDDESVLRLDDYNGKRFRDEFTGWLAQAGFDANYEHTKEDLLLEDLIDRFAR